MVVRRDTRKPPKAYNQFGLESSSIISKLMLLNSEQVHPARPRPLGRIDFRLIAGLILLAVAGLFTARTIDGLSTRRTLRTELAEIGHVRYGLLNAGRWVRIMLPILDARIDSMDLKAQDTASLRPIVIKALNQLLDQVQQKMSGQNSQPGAGGLFGQGNALIANMMAGALRPHIPEYADVVLAELERPENTQALKNYLKNYLKTALAEGAKSTFGKVDTRWYDSILREHGCANAAACREVLGGRIARMDAEIERYYLTVLTASALAFALLMIGRPVLTRSATLLLLLFCLVLLIGGVLTPMIEVEAKLSRISMTFLGQPIAFSDQVLYFQSKSVLEVFHTLITMGRPEMWVVGVLVLTFSVVFPALKISTLTFCLFRPEWLRRNRVVKFFALESSKWSMADVMALAIFMSFVAFNGVIANTMAGLRQTGAEVLIPTDSSKILPGYQLFIGFCLASLFLSKKLERGIRAGNLSES